MSFSLSDSTSEGILTDEKLERVFREIEEASERRAREEEEAESQPGPLDPFVSALSNAELAKKHRRQSISISRVGSYPDVPAEIQRTTSGPGSPVPWSSPPLYRTNTRTSTTSSLSPASSFASTNSRHHEEENHTTQKETIAGRRNTLTKAMSSAFSRTLTRMRSRGAINEMVPGDELVIGVAVHEATTETTIELNDAQEGGGHHQQQQRHQQRQAEGGAVAGAATSLPRVETRTQIEVGTAESPDPGPSRRMSVTIGAPLKAEGTRSRSGSIQNKLRGKLPLRSQAVSTDLKQAVSVENAPSASGSGASSSAVESGVFGAESSATKDGERDSGKNGNGNLKSGRRLSYFARVISQRLKRRKSGEESDKEKEKEKDKSKDNGKGKEKGDKQSDKRSQKSQTTSSSSQGEKEKEKERHSPPAPIIAPLPSASALLDQPILKSPFLSAPSPRGIQDSRGSSGIGIALPPSPRRLPSASEVPLPPSPAGSPRSPASTSSLPVSIAIAADRASAITPSDVDPVMIPLPLSPTGSSTFSVPNPSSGVGSSGGHGHSEGKRERLPASALPDSDFGPVSREPSEHSGETTPAPSNTPSPCPSPARSDFAPGNGPEREGEETAPPDTMPVSATAQSEQPSEAQLLPATKELAVSSSP